MALRDLLWLIPVAELASAATIFIRIRRPTPEGRSSAATFLAGLMFALMISAGGVSSGLQEVDSYADFRAQSLSTTGIISRVGGGKAQAYSYVYSVEGARYRGSGLGGYLERGPYRGQTRDGAREFLKT